MEAEIDWHAHPGLGRVKIPAGSRGQQLRNYRLRLHLSLADVAAFSGVPAWRLRGLERGQMAMLRDLEIYARALGELSRRPSREAGSEGRAA